MSRSKREINRRFRVFCEGDTEYNYFEYIRKNKLISLSLKPVNMHGGGYSNFLDEVKSDSNTDCLAKFVVIDGDRAVKTEEEKRSLRELANYCIRQNQSKRIPHFLIVDFPDFEYVACLHCENYKGGLVENFIKEELKYKSVEAFKSDVNVYQKLNSGKNSNKSNNIREAKRNSIVVNHFKTNKTTYEILAESFFIEENIGKKGTNFIDFFEIVESV